MDHKELDTTEQLTLHLILISCDEVILKSGEPLIQCDGVLIKAGHLATHTHTHTRRMSVKVKAELELMFL